MAIKDKSKTVTFKTEVQWCFHNKLDENGKYSIDLTNLSDNAIKALESIGMEVRYREERPEKGHFVTARSKFALPILDSNGNSLEDIMIANGSSGVAEVYAWSWEKNKKVGRSITLVKLVLDDVRIYSPSENQETAEDIL